MQRWLLSSPSPFSPTKQWQDWLAELETLPPDCPDVQSEIKSAERELARPRRQREAKD